MVVHKREDFGMTRDLTKGNIPKLLLGFLIPIIFGKLFQQIPFSNCRNLGIMSPR